MMHLGLIVCMMRMRLMHLMKMPILMKGVQGQTMNEANVDFYESLNDGNQELYKVCMKYSKLSFLIKSYHIKCLYCMLDKAMMMIFLKDAFKHTKIPNSLYEAKRAIIKFSLNYTKIHAYLNDYMLYQNKDVNKETCRICQTSRWKDQVIGKKKKQLAKVWHYFPLKQRLQKNFMSSKMVEHIRWHVTRNYNNGWMRHPRDFETWKKFDATYP